MTPEVELEEDEAEAEGKAGLEMGYQQMWSNQQTLLMDNAVYRMVKHWSIAAQCYEAQILFCIL